jgi:hypothetical protein
VKGGSISFKRFSKWALPEREGLVFCENIFKKTIDYYESPMKI